MEHSSDHRGLNILRIHHAVQKMSELTGVELFAVAEVCRLREIFHAKSFKSVAIDDRVEEGIIITIIYLFIYPIHEVQYTCRPIHHMVAYSVQLYSGRRLFSFRIRLMVCG